MEATQVLIVDNCQCQCQCQRLVCKYVAMRRRICVALEFIAHKKADTELTEQNKQAMALTHGFAHGIVQSVLFSIRYALVVVALDSASKILLRPIPALIYSRLHVSLMWL